MQAFFAGVALFVGEFLMIAAEVGAAKYFSISSRPSRVFWIALFVAILSCLPLVYGYTYGYRHFKNIWIISAISISGILVLEPLVAWTLFREIPTLGAMIALGLAVIGIVVAIWVK